jgi:surface protein
LGTTADKLNKLLETKANIKQAIIDKGVDVADDTKFADYPAKIGMIIADGDAGDLYYYKNFYDARTSNGTSMKGLFAYTSGDLDLSNLDTSKVSDMGYMFASCSSNYLDLSKFDTSKVTNMQYMFSNCISEINIDGWDTSKVTNMQYMFQNFTNKNKHLDLSVLDFSKVTNASEMFSGCNIDYVDIRNCNLNLSKFSSGYLPFKSVKGTVLDLSNYDITGLKSTYNLCYFCGCSTVNLTNWKTTEVTDMRQTFYYCSSLLELIIPDWDMTNVTNTSSMFGNTSNIKKIDISRSNNITLSKITPLIPSKTKAAPGTILVPEDLDRITYDALIAKYWIPIGAACADNITSCTIASVDEIMPGKSTKVFVGAYEPWYADLSKVEMVMVSDSSIATIDEDNVITSTGVLGDIVLEARIKDTQEVVGTKTITVSEVDNYPNVIKVMITGNPSSTTTVFKINESNVALNKLTKESDNFYSYDAGNPITSVNFNTSYVSHIIKLNTSNITSLYRAFYHSSSNPIIYICTEMFNTSNVTSMSYMFYYCKSLTSLDLSNWDTSKVTIMDYMFQGCELLTDLDLSSFDMSKVTSTSNMFNACTSLTNLQAPRNINTNIDLGYRTLLTHDSLMSVINNLMPQTSTKTLTLGATNLAKLTDEEKAIATNKGWTLK